MEQYIVSARKYRPDSFESLIGQDNIARTLQNSIKRGQLAHAYLFCGPRGVGKTTTARIFAKMINCSSPGPDMEPCGQCESCVSFQEGRSYCIHELDAASNNGVDDIKALMDQVQVPPQVGRYSVYIIDEVHMLSTAAFNAFLKTLEEPPAHAIFILATTEKHKVLPTILSRCQTYDFNRISVPDIARNLREVAAKEGVGIDEKSLHVIAMKADGAMRDALTIFDQTVAFCGSDVRYEDVIRNLNVLDYQYSFRLTDHFLAGEYGPALLLFDEILSKGFNALHFVAALSQHFRDLVVARTAGLEALLQLPDSLRQDYGAQAAKCPLSFLYDALGITTQCEAGYKTSTHPRLHIEFALMKLCFLAVPPERPAAQPVAAVQSPEKPAAAAPAAAKPTVGSPAAAPAPPAIPGEAKESPATAPETPRRRAAKTGSSLSINALMEEKEAAPAPREAATEDFLPGDESLQAAWQKLIGRYTDRPRLATALGKASLLTGTEDGVRTVVFHVVNTAQQQWIEEKLLRELEKSYRDILGSSRVRLHVGVVPEEEAPKTPYMPEEKAKDLIAKNPQVKSLVTDLGLDIK